MSTAPTGQWADADVEVRVQPYRSLDDLALPTESTLLEILAELRKLSAAIGTTGSISSVELTVDSKAVVKPTIKIYNLDVAVACAQAQELFDDMIIKYSARGTP